MSVLKAVYKNNDLSFSENFDSANFEFGFTFDPSSDGSEVLA